MAVWEVATAAEVRRFPRLSTGVGAVAFNADGSIVAAGSGGAGGELPEAGEVRVWSVDEGRTIQAFKVAEEAEPGVFISATEVALAPDGRRVAVAIGSGWRGKPVGLLVPDGEASLGVWDVARGRRSLDLLGPKGGINRITFSPDGRRIAAAGSDRAVQLWDAETGRLVATLPFDAKSIDALAFSPDGRRLAAGGGDGLEGSLKVWTLPGE